MPHHIPALALVVKIGDNFIKNLDPVAPDVDTIKLMEQYYNAQTTGVCPTYIMCNQQCRECQLTNRLYERKPYRGCDVTVDRYHYSLKVNSGWWITYVSFDTIENGRKTGAEYMWGIAEEIREVGGIVVKPGLDEEWIIHPIMSSFRGATYRYYGCFDATKQYIKSMRGKIHEVVCASLPQPIAEEIVGYL
jgi:hypothetical protein